LGDVQPNWLEIRRFCNRREIESFSAQLAKDRRLSYSRENRRFSAQLERDQEIL
jgi:hypothetical protein